MSAATVGRASALPLWIELGLQPYVAQGRPGRATLSIETAYLVSNPQETNRVRYDIAGCSGVPDQNAAAGPRR